MKATTIKNLLKKRHVHISSIVLGLFIAMIAIVSGKSNKARAGEGTAIEIAAPATAEAGSLFDGVMGSAEAVPEPKTPRFIEGMPVTFNPSVPVSNEGLSIRPEVNLNEKQTNFIKKLHEYLQNRNKYAIVTSAVRTGESQLSIIKQRISEAKAEAKFPELENATMEDTSVWVKAWQYLRARRVPINPPGDIVVKGRTVRQSSAHLKGLAMDFISNNLGDLRNVMTGFMKSKEYKQSGMRISAVVLEPYCVHLTLAG